ncbi:putative nucleotidyltransferase with HDIG domain [Thermosipho japonicus]|uniref:Putative nucleotidyltransferase with HDIG domain n=1 Tax=Thermosipho japonicus TaxID=90323 RepID=A0A841GSC5_9BACT|nr:HD domain-containing phosphohydrolase [Thermosipho japonicus]MBB6062498.1 putative nucleotidyltransferase with HDIG domain [Thermosipho japonicus]
MRLKDELILLLRKCFYVLLIVFILMFVAISILLFNFEKNNLVNFANFVKSVVEEKSFDSSKSVIDYINKLIVNKKECLFFSPVKENRLFYVSVPIKVLGYNFVICKDLRSSFFKLVIIFGVFLLMFLIIYYRLKNSYVKFAKELEDGLKILKASMDHFQNYLELSTVNRELRIAELDELKERFNYLQRVVLDNEKELQEMFYSEERLRKEVEQLNNLLVSVYDILSNIVPEEDLEEIAYKILKKLISIIPDVNAGSIILKDGGKYRFYAQIGYTDALKNIVFTDEDDVVAVKYEGFVDGKIFKEVNKKSVFKDEFEKLGSDKIKSSYIIPIYINNEKFGGICLDSFVNEKLVIPEYATEIFGKLFGNFLYLKLYGKRMEKLFEEILTMLVEVEEKLSNKEHSKMVASVSKIVTEKMGLDVEKVYMAAYLHDIGKIMVNGAILKKPGRLTEKERKSIETHVEYGYELLSKFEGFKDIAKIVLYHHERCDGKGYPKGLKCEQIPIESRIISAVDVCCTLMIKGYEKDEVINLLRKDVENGKLDGNIVGILIELLRDNII